MNRQAITQAAKDVLKEYKGTEDAGSPFAWSLLVTQAANDVAYKARCFFDSDTFNIISGVSDYIPTRFYAPSAVNVFTTTGGAPVPLAQMTSDDLTIWGVVEGLNTPAVPSQFIWFGQNRIRLVPTPNYSLANGLYIEGQAYPSNTWDQPMAECPLPLDAHWSVVYRAALLRSAQSPSQANQAITAAITAVYDAEVTQAQQNLASDVFTQDTAEATPPLTGGI